MSRKSRLLTSAFISFGLIIPLGFMVNVCGSLHGSSCAPIFAVPSFVLLLPTFVLADALRLPAVDIYFWLLFGVVNFLILTSLIYVTMVLWAKFRR